MQGVVGGGIYHSKMKAQERTDVLSRFKENEFNILIAVDALNEGVDIVDADAAICLSGVSTELTNTQQQGRIIRPKEGKKRPIFINLYSRNTVEKGWVDKKTVGTGLGKYVKWITNVRQIQTG